MAYADRTIGRFLSDIASTDVTPAGGTAAAVVGATGAALCEMACLHTVAHDDYADVAPELAEVGDDLRAQRTALLDLADRDAQAVEDLFGTALDSGTAATRKQATGVPLAIAQACLTVLDAATVVSAKGNRRAVPDAVTGAFLAHAALEASLFTVRSNLAPIEEPSFVEETGQRATDLETAAQTAFDEVLANAETDR